MPPKASRGGRVAASGTGAGGPGIAVRVRVEGVEKTTEDFKRIRRRIDTAMRDAMAAAGERAVVPVIKSRLPRKPAGTQRGLPSGALAGSITVKRDRLDVVIRSTLAKQLDRVLGWIDFGGQRRTTRYTDTKVRVGAHAIVGTLDAKAGAIDQAVLEELRRQFAGFDFR